MSTFKSGKIDVIIPTYNGLPFLKATIKSILDQTYSHFSLYVIDDGSTDDNATRKYVTSLKDARVKYVWKENGGQATARNLGIKISDSPYVTFCDSDDIWYPNKLEEQLALFKQHPRAGLVYGSQDYINENDEIIGGLDAQLSGSIFFDLLDGNKIAGSGSMVMIPRAVLDTVGLFHEDFLIGEDWELWLRIAKNYSVEFVPTRIAALRMLSNSMQTNHLKMARGLLYMLPIMTRELQLNRTERAELKASIFWQTSIFYFRSGQGWHARYYLVKLLLAKPSTILNQGRVLHYLHTLLGTTLFKLFTGTFKYLLPRKLRQKLMPK